MELPSVSRPVILDLFCGAGGAAMGYSRAGFDVVGVDIKAQPRYPFEFIQGDALEYLATAGLSRYSAIHASPPCQEYTIARQIHPEIHYPRLVGPTRDLLNASGLPYVIENVPGSPLINYFELCGRTFGLNVKRHRWFETNPLLSLLVPPCPKGHPGDWLLVFGQTVLSRGKTIGRAKGGGPRIKRTHQGTDPGRQALGIDWMNRDELSEAIPPAYTEYIGRHLMASIRANEGA